ncbi:hypothetical protein TNIN_148151 [Trichonephila inaurata madagascariensis]|uniref:Uncharacterized protein n=1 Tax=Trichonephila inaurata madagascariensis TaxID=2747483 RepID=A0A8X6WSS4_9ARAC|nr:hypothetical protein TNIN_148151 [Trichonephila inaurata madagascariensis]
MGVESRFETLNQRTVEQLHLFYWQDLNGAYNSGRSNIDGSEQLSHPLPQAVNPLTSRFSLHQSSSHLIPICPEHC